MSEAFQAGVYKGWHWRFILLTAVILTALEIAADLLLHQGNMLTYLPVGVMVAAYMTAPRVKERRLANTVLCVVTTFVFSLVAEIVIDWPHMAHGRNVPMLIETNMFALLLGLVMSYAYLRLTMWSEKKREQLEARRRGTTDTAQSTPPVRRHNKKKKKR